MNKDELLKIISRRNTIDYAFNAEIMGVLQALRDSVLIHYGLEEFHEAVIWPTVDIFDNADGMTCIVVMAYIHNNGEDNVGTSMSGVVPLQLALDNDVDAILQYVTLTDVSNESNPTPTEVTVH